MADITNAGGLTDKDYLSDFLHAQKQVAADYNRYAGECVNTQLRSEMLTLLDDEHDIQSDIFNQMHERGWYRVKGAEQAEVEAVKAKFSV